MKKILVLGLGHLSNGELTIVAETLCQIRGKSFEVLFVSHPERAHYIKSMGFPVVSLNRSIPKENKKEFERIMSEWNPDILLCADVFTMDYAASWSGINFVDLKKLGIPLGSMDQYEWESTSFSWDFLGTQPSKMNASLIKECDFLIRPCPLNKPFIKEDERICTSPLFSQILSPPRTTRSQWCEKLGIAMDRKIVFTVNSSWEYLNITKLIRIQNLIIWMPRMIHEYLAGIHRPLSMIHVGPKKWDFPIKEHIQYHYFNKLDTSLYRDGLYHADLFCSTNATSITLSMAAYFQTPSILFQNLKTMDFAKINNVVSKMPAWYQKMAVDVERVERFRMFPWGWYSFLKPVFEDSPYTSSFITVPILIPKKAMNLIKRYLTDENSIQRLKENQYSYFKKIEKLAPVGTFLQKLIS